MRYDDAGNSKLGNELPKIKYPSGVATSISPLFSCKILFFPHVLVFFIFHFPFFIFHFFPLGIGV